MSKGLVGNFFGLTIDGLGFTKALDTQLGDLIKASAKTYIRTALDIIPVWSGASRATFKKIGNLVGYTVSVFPVTSIDSRGRTRQAPNRIAEGEAHSDGELFIKFPNYAFIYKSDLHWLNVNERVDATQFGFNLIKPGPYEFVKAAEAAATATMNNMLKGFRSNIRKHIKPFNIRF